MLQDKMASEQGSHWLIESIHFLSMYNLPVCDQYVTNMSGGSKCTQNETMFL